MNRKTVNYKSNQKSIQGSEVKGKSGGKCNKNEGLGTEDNIHINKI